MFSGLQISKEADFREHLNKYDVIHIDIQWFLANCEDVDNVVTLITDSVLSELREIYPDIFTWEGVLSRCSSGGDKIPARSFIADQRPDREKVYYHY